jgi:flagellar capping protein FliD
MESKISSFKTLMSSYESKLYKRYDAMEVALSKLNAQFNFLNS